LQPVKVRPLDEERKDKAHVLEVELVLIIKAVTCRFSAVCRLCEVRDLPLYTGWFITKSTLTSSAVFQQIAW
jgi:hypothetical protein